MAVGDGGRRSIWARPIVAERRHSDGGTRARAAMNEGRFHRRMARTSARRTRGVAVFAMSLGSVVNALRRQRSMEKLPQSIEINAVKSCCTMFSGAGTTRTVELWLCLHHVAILRAGRMCSG